MNKLFTTIAIFGAALSLTACAGPNGPKRAVLPLDHGPRAQTTPWENKQRLLRLEKAAQARETR